MLLELCKDRTGLLVDPDAPPPQTWYTPRLTLAGLPTGAPWPPAERLAALLKARGCAPASAADLEDGAVALLETGALRTLRCAALRAPSARLRAGATLPSVGGARAGA